MQNLYETLLIVAPEADDDTVAAVIGDLRAVVETDGGNVLQAGVWQRRKLAYAVQGKTEGIYVLMYADGNNTLPAALKDRMRLDEAVIRSLVVRVGDRQEADVRQKIAEAETADQEQIDAQLKAAERRHEAEQAAAAMSLEEQVAAEESDDVESEGEALEEMPPPGADEEPVAGGIGVVAVPDVEPVVDPESGRETEAAGAEDEIEPDAGAEAGQPEVGDAPEGSAPADAEDSDTEDKEI